MLRGDTKSDDGRLCAAQSVVSGTGEDAVRLQPEHFVIGERDDAFFRCIFDGENQDTLVAQLDDAVVGICGALESVRGLWKRAKHTEQSMEPISSVRKCSHRMPTACAFMRKTASVR